VRVLPRILLFLGLAYLTFVLFSEAQSANSKPDVDTTKIVMLFGAVVLVGGTAGILFALMVMPALGDAVGNFFFQPNDKIEKGPHSDAQGAVARGDYAGAVEAYRRVLANDPSDTLAVSEIAKHCCEHLNDPAAAAAALEEALNHDLLPEEAAFLSSRLVDVYWRYQRDARNARALLLQIVETMPGTRHAANAQHRLQEIEKEIALEG
jgi:tetratricopeptide (TPR) repeat protein